MKEESELTKRLKSILDDANYDFHYTFEQHHFIDVMQKAYNLDRQTQGINRFEIELSGKPFLGFETEAHITDDQNPTCTIIVKSGYSTIEETLEYANKILKMLNNGSL